MNKKLLLGSILVLALLLLMPSIPAVQQITIEEGIKQEFTEKLNSINFKDIIDEYLSDNITHPILYQLVIIWLTIGFGRSFFWVLLALLCSEFDEMTMSWGAKYVILFDIFMFLHLGMNLRLRLWIGFIKFVSDKMGWNWEIPNLFE